MGYNFVPCDRKQPYLMPPSLSDWLPEGHLAWFVLDAVDQIDLSSFYAKYHANGVGNSAFHPSMMVSLLIYAYCTGERSSRQIEKHCQSDVAYKVIAANQSPDHTTISRFRKDMRYAQPVEAVAKCKGLLELTERPHFGDLTVIWIE